MSDFKEEQKSNRRPKSETKENQKCARLCTARHSRAVGAATTHGWHSHTHGCACDRVPEHGRASARATQPCDFSDVFKTTFLRSLRGGLL